MNSQTYKDYTIYVNEDIAKKAIEKGFECDIVTTAVFGEEPHCYNEFQIDRTLYRCPTAEQVCGWLREEKGIKVLIGGVINGDYEYYGNAYLRDKPCYGVGYEGNDYSVVLLETIKRAIDKLI